MSDMNETMSNMSNPIRPLYSDKLNCRLMLPSRQSMLAIIRDIESGYRCLKTSCDDPKKQGLMDEIGERIELLKTCGLNKKFMSSQKVVFFRETAHHIEEDFLLVMPPPTLCAQAFKIREQLKLSNLPDNIKTTWGDKLDGLIQKIEEINADICSQDPEKTDKRYNNYDAQLSNLREVLRATMHLINRSIDNSFIELYITKINNVLQLVFFIFILTSLMLFLHSLDTSNDVTSPTVNNNIYKNYIYYLLVGAFGGSLSAIISKSRQSLVKGSFAINLILNVISRPIIGAASAFALVFIAESQLYASMPKPADPFKGLLVLSLIAGFGGEKLLRSTMDQLIKRLSEESSKIAVHPKQRELGAS